MLRNNLQLCQILLTFAIGICNKEKNIMNKPRKKYRIEKRCVSHGETKCIA